MSKQNEPQATPKQICFVAPFDLSEWLEKKAHEEHRSVSGQIVYFLSKAQKESEK